MKTIGDTSYPELPSELKSLMLDCIARQRRNDKSRGLFILRHLNDTQLGTVENFIKSFLTEKDFEEGRTQFDDITERD